MNLRPLINIEEAETPFIPYTVKISTKSNILDQKRGLIELKPCYHVMIRVTPKVVDTSEDFVGFDVQARQCKLPYEADELRFLQNYTKDGCELECAINISLAICNCLPWYLPNYFREASMCDMFGAKCFDIVMSDERNYKNCTDKCLEDCRITSFAAIPSYVPIDSKKTCKQPIFKTIFEKLYSHLRYEMFFDHVTMGKWPNFGDSSKTIPELCQDYVSKYISIITVETPVNSVVKAKRVARISFNDQLAVIGGTLGLFTGISVLSMVEFVCFCLTMTKRICHIGKTRLCKKKMVTIEAIDEEKKDGKGNETYVVQFVSETIKRAANQNTRKPENKMPNVS